MIDDIQLRTLQGTPMTRRKTGFYAKWLLLLIASVAVSAVRAEAQLASARIQVQSLSGDPIVGALVAVVDDAGKTIVEGLTSAAGTRTITVSAGKYRIKVRRIGFRPFLSDLQDVRSGAILFLTVPHDRISLEQITVSETARCGRIEAEPASLGIVWSEVIKALRSSELTVNDLSGIADARSYRKIVGDGGGILLNDSTRHRLLNQRPFAAADPRELAANGYVRGDEITGWDYFGPDEAVLLSNEFAATHCFRLVRDRSRRGWIGIGFEPTPGRKLSDIAGTLWLDEFTSELKELTFHFVNAGAASRFGGKGQTNFRRMPSGAWIVSDWWMRMPRLELNKGEGIRIRARGYEEIGGGVIEGSIGSHLRGARVTVKGVVVDSVSGIPLPGATVYLGRSVALSDSAGRFTFVNAPSGPATLTFSHPSLSRFGVIAIESAVDIKIDSPDHTLATPSLRSLWLRFCRDSAIDVPVAERGILHGIVTDDAAQPVANATVAIYWSEYRPSPGEGSNVARLSINASTDGTGRYAVCGFRRLVHGSIRATTPRFTSERREFSFANSLVIRRDLTLSKTAALRTDTLYEVRFFVADSATGNPLSDASISLRGHDGTLRTDDSGRASTRVRVADLDIVVRRLGFSEQSARATLRAGRMSQVDVSLSPIQVLSEVRIHEAGPLPASLVRRRDQGRGVFVGPEDLSVASDVRAILARTRADLGTSGRLMVAFRHPSGGQCWADIYIDGQLSAASVATSGSSRATGTLKSEELASMSPGNIYAMEIYERASQAPPEYAGVRDGCGVILVWTRSYVESGMQ